ncbi:MAG: hypothetical protein EOP22_07160 [Hyphomicrobiales bacterium]|nr:MAG: hypothetical protein EOP22_07160 [Hyphomicrobiales bacterium]
MALPKIAARLLMLPPFIVAGPSLLAILPWLLAQPASDSDRLAGWALGMVALVAYPILMVVLFGALVLMTRRQRLHGDPISEPRRLILRLAGATLLLAFIIVMTAAVIMWIGA